MIKNIGLQQTKTPQVHRTETSIQFLAIQLQYTQILDNFGKSI